MGSEMCIRDSNTIIVPWVLRLVYEAPGTIWYLMITVGAGEVISCGILGMILLFALSRYRSVIFPDTQNVAN